MYCLKNSTKGVKRGEMGLTAWSPENANFLDWGTKKCFEGNKKIPSETV